ncbi:hypothetical protein AMAG_03094 [Allomyces macrogynus ATCC 38327]|uniref:Fungal lipase-type domain-containing protein n=1 Tax=Allomyces macrogynus (strain ATCC 38327) TaxID=578462 RepID=A0A0L0S499_ALLM3|nr:hypothetical protein AMAG_03094 [Allomyces macrogynus ATCC 38327]|eukprot:KNE57373.1 hypothetical protein AMAG_03094 [Allomyces macrogynus ATCC 38327]
MADEPDPLQSATLPPMPPALPGPVPPRAASQRTAQFAPPTAQAPEPAPMATPAPPRPQWNSRMARRSLRALHPDQDDRGAAVPLEAMSARPNAVLSDHDAQVSGSTTALVGPGPGPGTDTLPSPPPLRGSRGSRGNAGLGVTQYLQSLATDHIGPPTRTRFHRANGWRRAVHFLASVAMLGGMVLLITILFCVLVSLSYMMTQVDLGSLTWLVVVAGTFYAFVVLSLSRTWLRTALRLVIWIWSTPRSQKNNDFGELQYSPGSQAPATTADRMRDLFRPDEVHLDYRTFIFFLTVPSRLMLILVDWAVEGIVNAVFSYRARQAAAALARKSTNATAVTGRPSPTPSQRQQQQQMQQSGMTTAVNTTPAPAPALTGPYDPAPASLYVDGPDKATTPPPATVFQAATQAPYQQQTVPLVTSPDPPSPPDVARGIPAELDDDTARLDRVNTFSSALSPAEVVIAEAEEKADLKDRVRVFFYAGALTVVFVVPCVIVASVKGYSTIASFLSVVFVAAAAITVVVVNALNRFFRCLSFCVLMWKGILEPDRRRAMYVASAGQDTRLDIFDSLAEQILKTLAVILALCVISSAKGATGLYITIGILMAILSLFRLRSFFGCCIPTIRNKDNKAVGPPNPKEARSLTGYYTGQRRLEPVVVFFVRVLVLILGLTALALTDFTDIHDPATQTKTSLAQLFKQKDNPDKTVNTAKTFGYLGVFAFCYLLKDVALLVTRIPHQIAALMLVVSFVGKVIFAAFVANQYVGLLSTAVLVLMYQSFDLRDGHAFWTGGRHDLMRSAGSAPLTHVRAQRRARVNAMVTIGLIVGAVVISIAIGFAVGTQQGVVDAGGTAAQQQVDFLDVTQPYPYCHMQFGGQFSLVDFVTLSGAVYRPDKDAAVVFANQNPALRGLKVKVEYDSLAEDKNGSKGGVRFMEFRFDTDRLRNVSVVAIRGTNNLEDILQDLHLWSTPLLLQASSYLGTFAAIWPRETTATLVSFLSKYVAFSNFLYYKGVENYVTQTIKPTESNRTVFLTGHSLGGGLSLIVGSRLKIPAVGVSSPGLGMSYKNYDTSIEAITRWGMNIVPFSDPVPMADEQIAGTLHIPCYQRVPSDCHKWRNTLRTLINSCAGKTAPGQTTA